MMRCFFPFFSQCALAALLSIACASDDGGAAGDATTATGSTTGTGSGAGTMTPTTAAGTTALSGETADGSTTAPSATTLETDTGAASTGVGQDTSTGGEPAQRVLFAVGYGGMRVRSLDDGLTWQDYTQLVDAGGDDMELLRGCAWGNGRFVAAGWRIFGSNDGVTWEEHDNPTGQWLGAVAYGNDLFLGVGGGGYCARSDDGINWSSCTDVTDGAGFEHVRSTVFTGGLFYTADADGDVRSSPDGDVWTFEQNLGTAWVAVQGGVIVAREENAPAEFADLRLRGSIERADAGTDQFTSVFSVPNDNGVFQAYRFAFCEGFIDP